MSTVFYSSPTFGIADSVVFALFLALSGGVGIFFSRKGKGTTGDYFLGSRQMHPIPVGLSTGVSFLSAALLIGIPAEIYINGYQYVFANLAGAVGFFLASCMLIRILYTSNLTSLHDYYSRRFASPVVTFLANIFVLFCIFQYMGVCMLGSVIAFNSVTGGRVSVVVALAIGGGVGIFYTSLGGLRAVVWTDVLQSVVMIAGLLAVMVRATLDASGVSSVIATSRQFSRLHQPEWSPDPTVRHTMWGILIGNFFSWAVWAAQPANVQRLCSTRGRSEARIIAGVACCLFVLFTIFPAWCGLSIFAFYAQRGCDVFSAGWIKENEIMLYYIRERLAWPGFQGLFMAALYAGSLSSFSSGLNAASAVLWKDLLQKHLFPNASETRAILASKLLVVAFGLASMVWCFVLHAIGGLILQLSISIDSAIYSTYFTVFLVAACLARAQWKGTVVGMVLGFGITITLGVGSLLKGSPQVASLPTVIDRCAANVTGNWTLPSVSVNVTAEPETSPGIFSLSYAWLALLCILITFFTAFLVSLCTGPARDVDPALILSCKRRREYDLQTEKVRLEAEAVPMKEDEKV